MTRAYGVALPLGFPAVPWGKEEHLIWCKCWLQAVNQLMIDDWRDENYYDWDDSDSGAWTDDGLVTSETPVAASSDENIDIKGDNLDLLSMGS